MSDPVMIEADAPAATEHLDSRWWRFARDPRLPGALLACFLVIAVPVLVRSKVGDPWFMGDDWGLLQERSLGRPSDWWRPQNGHWSTVPIVIYQTILGIFGLHHFLLFRLVVVLAHLAVVALSWKLLRRLGLSSWYSLAAVVPLVLLGSMPINLVSPIQVSQTGSVAFGLAFLLASDHDGPFDRRDVLGMCMGLLSLASSGMGPIMVLTVGVALLLRRGWRIALVEAGALMAIFVSWQQLTGAAGADTSGYSASDVVGWIYQGLTATFSSPTMSGVLGLALGIFTVAGLLVMVRFDGFRPFRGPRAVLPALVFGAVVNFAAVATQRWYMGVKYARTDRYVYVSLVMLVPVIATALAALRVMWKPLPYLLLLPLLVAVPANVAALGDPPRFSPAVSPWRFLGAVREPLAREVDPTLELDPNVLSGRGVTIGWLLDLDRRGKLPPSPALTAAQQEEIRLRLSISRRELASTPTACATSAGPVDLDLVQGDVVHVNGSVLVQRLEAGEPVGPRVAFYINSVWSPAADLKVEVPVLSVRIQRSAGRTLEWCR